MLRVVRFIGGQKRRSGEEIRKGQRPLKICDLIIEEEGAQDEQARPLSSPVSTHNPHPGHTMLASKQCNIPFLPLLTTLGCLRSDSLSVKQLKASGDSSFCLWTALTGSYIEPEIFP